MERPSGFRAYPNNPVGDVSLYVTGWLRQTNPPFRSGYFATLAAQSRLPEQSSFLNLSFQAPLLTQPNPFAITSPLPHQSLIP